MTPLLAQEGPLSSKRHLVLLHIGGEEVGFDGQSLRFANPQPLFDEKLQQTVNVDKFDCSCIILGRGFSCALGEGPGRQKDAAFRPALNCAAKLPDLVRPHGAVVPLALEHDFGSDEPVDEEKTFAINALISGLPRDLYVFKADVA